MWVVELITSSFPFNELHMDMIKCVTGYMTGFLKSVESWKYDFANCYAIDGIGNIGLTMITKELL